MVSITHFSHEHPLILLKQLPPGKKELICYGCDQLLSQEQKDSDVYGCKRCKTIFLHKSCAEIPMEIVHKSHRQHSLFLLSKRPVYYRPQLFYCYICRTDIIGFSYTCHLCKMSSHVRCATEEKGSLIHFSKDLILNHPSHEHHPLTLIPRPTSFRCDACDVQDEDLSYHCLSCNYMIHRRCAMLPSITNHDVHDHPLSLSFGLPSQYHRLFHYKCDGCNSLINAEDPLWLYYCGWCRYFVHIRCMELKKPEVEKVDLTGLPDDLPRFPLRDKSVELIHHFLLKSNNLSNVQHVISRPGHIHPLLYSDDQIVYEIEDGEEVLCDGCIEPINSPHYHCAECRYYLHLHCAELPKELQHPSHEHPLILTNDSRFFDKLKCHDCEKKSNGFFFSCTSNGCDFRLDVKCAALPNALKNKTDIRTVVEHKSHDHPLVICTDLCFECRCCGNWGFNMFDCDPCGFDMHRECAMLRETTKHKFDSKHLIRLRWPPHYYHPAPFDCAECEEEIDPNYCLYHCEESDLSFHVGCINLSWKTSNSKFGQKLRTVSHQHPLKYVYKASVRCPCHRCGTEDCKYFCLECETCNFHLCESCVQEIQPRLGAMKM